MKSIIKTIHLESKNSSYLIDFVHFKANNYYVEITQTINTSIPAIHSVKINPIILTELIKVLQNYQAKFDITLLYNRVDLTDNDKANIVKNYLKGVSIIDLALQFNQSKELIEMVLRNNDIAITYHNTPPKRTYYKRKRKQ